MEKGTSSSAQAKGAAVKPALPGAAAAAAASSAGAAPKAPL